MRRTVRPERFYPRAVIATVASLAALLLASAIVGQAILVLCGRNAASAIAPAFGLAALCGLAWGFERLPGGVWVTAAGLGITILFGLFAARRVTGAADLAIAALPVVLIGALAAALPFIISGRFGILGTGLNPDMSQHLYATLALVDGSTDRLISSGYPLGPHALVAGLGALGVGPVQGFGGLSLATAVAACVAPLGELSSLRFGRRITGCLLVGLAYMAASYLIQGAFKEILQALFVLATALYLAELERGRERGLFVRVRTGEDSVLRAGVPIAVLAAASVYLYSFPGVAWILGAVLVFGGLRILSGAAGGPIGILTALRAWILPAALAALAGLVLIAPELPRILDFAQFETFDPDGAGLGNLFNPISPLEAFGIWPSGDFRLDAGAGAVPAPVFWAGGALGIVATLYGIVWSLRRGELAIVSAFLAAAALATYSVLLGTPYQAAKAIALLAPVATLLAVRALLADAVDLDGVSRLLRRRRVGDLAPRKARDARAGLGVAFIAATFVLAAGLCSALVLVNGPVGPRDYDSELRNLATGLDSGSTLVLAPESEFADGYAIDFYTWEFRGGRVCVEPALREGSGTARPPRGIARIVTLPGGSSDPPFGGLGKPEVIGDYALWEPRAQVHGSGRCPFVSDGARSNPASGSGS